MRLVIFDFDGTLGDTRSVIVATMQATITALGLPTRTDAECAAVIGLPLAECFAALFPDASTATAQRGADTYRRIFAANMSTAVVPLFPHVLDTLEALDRRGYTLSIASSRSRGSLLHFVRDMHLDRTIAYVVGADDVESHKPHPEPVLKTMAHFGCAGGDADDVWVVGDMTFDILMGRGAGVRTVGVTYGNGTRQELASAGADYVIDDLRQLLFIVDQTDVEPAALPEGHFVRSH